MLRINWMTTDDVNEVHALVSTSFEPKLRPYMTSAQPGAARFLDAFVRYGALRPDRCYRVARSAEGSLLGYADLRLTGESTSFLSYIAVAPEARGRGVAGAILDSFLAEHPDVSSMELDVFAQNVAARGLYEKRGFSSKNRTEWWVRKPPAPSRVPAEWVLNNAADATAWANSFGFCEYQFDTGVSLRRFGQIGAETLKCYSARDFQDDGLLSAVTAIIPTIQRVLFVGESDLGPPVSDCYSINSSLRMACHSLRTFGG